jgi:hypothetical protein
MSVKSIFLGVAVGPAPIASERAKHPIAEVVVS